MPFYPVLEAFGGNLHIAGLGASTESQHVHHFPGDLFCLSEVARSYLIRSADI